MRHPDWQRRFNDFITQNKTRAFAWGDWDCCLFAADFVKHLTGIDYAADFRGHYTTAIGSVRALRRYGKGSIQDTLNSLLGEPIPRLSAQRGDVALVETAQGPAAGVVAANGILVLTESGIGSVPLRSAILIWGVR